MRRPTKKAERRPRRVRVTPQQGEAIGRVAATGGITEAEVLERLLAWCERADVETMVRVICATASRG